MSIRVLHTILGFILTGTEDDEAKHLVNGPIECLGRLDARNGTVYKVLTEEETRDWHQPKLYPDMD